MEEDGSDRKGFADIAMLLLNIAAYMLVVDLIVETWIAQSPLKFWFAGLGLLYLAGCTALSVRKVQWWRGLATSVKLTSTFLLLVAMISLSALHADGISVGPAMLQLSPDQLALVLVALALVWTGTCVVLWRSLPMIFRVAIGVFLSYSLCALVLGFVEGRGLSSLVSGSSFFDGLPVWLQGARLGALVLLPVCLVLSAIRFYGWEMAWLTGSAKSLLILATAIALVPSIQGLRIPPTVEQPGFQFSREELTEKIERSYELAHEYYDTLNIETLDVSPLVTRIGDDPERILEYVRTNTGFIPYRGMLRGSEGVLADRLGNSLDRTLLLQSMLDQSGQDTRLMHAVLSDSQLALVQEELKVVSMPRIAESDTSLTVAEIASELGLSESFLQAPTARDKAISEALTEASGQIRDQASYLVSISDARFGSGEGDVDLEALRDHWWLQLREGSHWLDLDPSDLHESDDPPEGRVVRGDIPNDLTHKVKIRVGMSRESGTEVKETILTEASLVAADYSRETVRIVNLPLLDRPEDGALVLPDAQTVWIPIIATPEGPVSNKAFDMTGKVIDAREAQVPGRGATDKVGDVIDLFGSMGSEESDQQNQQSDVSIRLQSFWIDYVVEVPGKPNRVIRRTIFEKKGLMDEPAVAIALSAITDVALQTYDMTDRQVEAVALKQVLDEEAEVTRALAVRSMAEARALSSQYAQLPPNAHTLHSLAALRSLRDNSETPLYLSEPNVLTQHMGFRMRSPDTAVPFYAFDIVHNRVAALEGSKLRTARIIQGVWDTHAEYYLIKGLTEGSGSEIGPTVADSFTAGVGHQVTEDGRWLRVGTHETGIHWLLHPDGSTLGMSAEGWGGISAEHAPLVTIMINWGLCLGSGVAIAWMVNVEDLTRTGVTAGLLCTLGAGAAMFSELASLGIASKALLKGIQTLIGLLPTAIETDLGRNTR